MASPEGGVRRLQGIRPRYPADDDRSAAAYDVKSAVNNYAPLLVATAALVEGRCDELLRLLDLCDHALDEPGAPMPVGAEEAMPAHHLLVAHLGVARDRAMRIEGAHALPWQLRYAMGYDHRLCAQLMAAFAAELSRSYRRRAKRALGLTSVSQVLTGGKKGELRQPYREGQEDQLGTLGLVINAIVLWNTRYMNRALDQLQAEGARVRDEDVERPSPLGHEHINFHGRYSFGLPDEVQRGELRPLRDPHTASEEL